MLIFPEHSTASVSFIHGMSCASLRILLELKPMRQNIWGGGNTFKTSHKDLPPIPFIDCTIFAVCFDSSHYFF